MGETGAVDEDATLSLCSGFIAPLLGELQEKPLRYNRIVSVVKPVLKIPLNRFHFFDFSLDK